MRIATVQSARICAATMSRSKGGHYSSLLLLNGSVLKKVNPSIHCTTTMGYTILGEEFYKETVIEPRPEDYIFCLEIWGMCETLIRERKVKTPSANHQHGRIPVHGHLQLSRVAGREEVRRRLWLLVLLHARYRVPAAL
ncbi:hypothetical protein CDEST_01122 [Colletotrichum destructivum]|uniref:Uncharacterized protein n=1 Tax=Colletotrichum destructivum TaxID=34406 RepID=A0AAX4HZ48_9PEZI|nr:hypothetical protein CDEST_01122 [Colletotrichum destructivum]